ncbi:hypothetical protein HK098_001098 [Nowakowskiella sp. JEL0407]|nr:hypothetical protein HK098_001098 [Nowakowskiella sp. JEL0407]
MAAQTLWSLLTVLVIDFGIQFLFYIHAIIFTTEKYYDFSGALTNISMVTAALFWRHDAQESIASLHPRQITIAVFVYLWAIRLGGYLFWRILKENKDSRFTEFKKNPFEFAKPWFIQFLWIILTGLAAFIVLGNPTSQQALFAPDYIGIIIWVFGFMVEVVADYQKTVFKAKNPRMFISTGIWSWSRYANYNGEITLWIGMFILCIGGFVEPWNWVGIISPVFVAGLIIGVSGIPLLEKSSNERYGHMPEYQQYKARTSTFFLWPPRKHIHVNLDSELAS